jgi:hypothetical protein
MCLCSMEGDRCVEVQRSKCGTYLVRGLVWMSPCNLSALSCISLAIGIAQLPIISMNGDVLSFFLCAMCEARFGSERVYHNIVFKKNLKRF